MKRAIRAAGLAWSVAAAALLAPASAGAQIVTLTREQLVQYTAASPFARFPDGRPKIPDALLERAKGMSAEEVWAVLPGKGFRNQYEDGFQVLHPGMKLAGRAVTVQFMPSRPDVDGVLQAQAKARGLREWNNQCAIDMLQPGDVLVVDLFGKNDGGTIVGDNLFYYMLKTARAAGLVVDGGIRDLDGIASMEMPAYFRHAHPSAIADVMLTAINVPVRIGNVTVMPGDLVFGDREGVYFIPPALIGQVLENAEKIHIHDEWTRKKFDEGRYKSSEIYSSPADPQLKREYDEYLNKQIERRGTPAGRARPATE